MSKLPQLSIQLDGENVDLTDVIVNREYALVRHGALGQDVLPSVCYHYFRFRKRDVGGVTYLLG